MAIQKVLQGMVSGSLVTDLTSGTSQETEAQITKAKPTPRRPTPSNSVAYKNYHSPLWFQLKIPRLCSEKDSKHMTVSCGQSQEERDTNMTFHAKRYINNN